MNHLAHYSVLQARPSRDRHEIVTVGLAILRDGNWDIRILPNPAKILGLNPRFPSIGLVNIQRVVSALLDGADGFEVARARLARHGGDPTLQPYVGQFLADSDAHYESKVSELMRVFVLPEEHVRPASAKPKANRLRTRLKNHFRTYGLLATGEEDIGEHKVVERFPIVPEQGLYAEFALKNGVMNITETVDFDVQNIPRKILEAQAKTLILSEAVKQFGAGTKRYVVVSGSYLRQAMPTVNLLNDHADVFELSSTDDMAKYFDLIQTAAESR